LIMVASNCAISPSLMRHTSAPGSLVLLMMARSRSLIAARINRIVPRRGLSCARMAAFMAVLSSSRISVLPGFGQDAAQARTGRPDLPRTTMDVGAIIGLLARLGQILLRD